jgi:hypothetical protein
MINEAFGFLVVLVVLLVVLVFCFLVLRRMVLSIGSQKKREI